ncbi:MAG TPA: hypothetical protein VK752_26610 [Bryobacteraceae bacterium]|jgi:hypothetical protein|nr:hypothetical protein [Bryobacteraceae bacterium]
MRVETIPLLLCLSGAMALAQLPGQYPGQYPPGQYPPGQTGNCPPGQYPPCNTRRQPTDATPGRSSKNTKSNKSTSTVTTTTIGTVRRSVPNQVVLEPTDHRIVWYRVTSTTKFMKNNKEVDSTAFAPGDHVTLDSTSDDEDIYTAVEVRFDTPGTPEERAKATEDWDLPKLEGGPVGKGGAVQREPGDDRPVLRRANSGDETSANDPAKSADTPAPQTAKAQQPPPEPEDNRPATTMRPPDPPKDADDPGPPSLRRGAPSKSQMAELPPPRYEPLPDAPPKPAPTADAPRQAADAPVLNGRPVDPIIEKAREAAANYLSSLPNYFCQQMTARYQSDHPKTGWDALDVVTADVAYQDGHESYKNIKIGNKPVNKSMEDIGGTRSTGEFSSVLEDLLSPYTDASFRKNGTDTLHGRSTWVYKYEIPRERSHWRIEAPSQLYYPAHTGTIWIDKETSRVMRIEQGTINMPKLFPFDTVETVTDYEFIALAAGQKYLLPADAEVLSCVRGTSMCSRNRLEFRNYRKFGAESTITFDGKQQ